MPDRESIFPLGLGLAVAIILHLAVTPLIAFQFIGSPPDQTPYPDLRITTIDVPEAIRRSDTILISWTGENRGELAIPPSTPWRDAVYLSKDNTLSPDDTLLTTTQITTGVATANTYQTLDIPIRLPDTTPVGLYHLIIQADETNTIPEHPHSNQHPHAEAEPNGRSLWYQSTTNQQQTTSNFTPHPRESNNTYAIPLWVESTDKPDLTIQPINPPTQITLGSTIALEYQVANQAEGIAWVPWVDRIYLSQNDSLDDTDLLLSERNRPRSLGPNDPDQINNTYTNQTGQRSFPLAPFAKPGPAHLIYQTNANEDLSEADTTNNLAIHPIEILNLETPDLLPTNLTVPPDIRIDQPFRIQLTSINAGNIEAVASEAEPWTDTIYLSTDDQLDSFDTVLSENFQTESIQPGQRYITDPITVRLPADISEVAYLIIHVDTNNTIDETIFEPNNIKVVEIRPRQENQPRETPEQFLGQDDAELPLSVAWIAFEDFQKLQAAQSPFEQPAIQAAIDPVPNAPVELDPTSMVALVTPTPNAAGQPDPQFDETIEGDDSPIPGNTAATTPTAQARQLPQAPTEIPDLNADEANNPDEANVPTPKPGIDQPTPSLSEAKALVPNPNPAINPATIPNDGQPDPTPTDSVEPSPTNSETPANQTTTTDGQQPTGEAFTGQADEREQSETEAEQQPQPDTGGDTTSAPRDDRESPPVQRRERSAVAIVPGQVFTAEGIEIKTVRPRFSVVTRVSTLPRNPVARITFDPETGNVIDARLTRSSGARSIDGPVLSALYKWQATGKRLEKIKNPFDIEMKIILVNE